MASNVDRGQVVSPVGQYIRNNPAPIVRQIHPKATRNFEEDLALLDRGDEDKTPFKRLFKPLPFTKASRDLVEDSPVSDEDRSTPVKRLFKPLPMAEYKSSRVALEQQMPSRDDHMRALPKVFGITPSVEAKVIRHVGRERVAKDADFLRHNSPVEGGTLVMRKPDPARESLMPDMNETNTMEMSIRQVVEVKKMTKH